MDWKPGTDKYGNPFIKFNDGTNRLMTIHYDKQGKITASHVKNPDGSREFINPADAFIAAEFMKKLK